MKVQLEEEELAGRLERKWSEGGQCAILEARGGELVEVIDPLLVVVSIDLKEE